ncbi:KGG domain-containing protein [Lysobacter sp. A6]|uniref:KGG domain-containing protein n=1 Tax=Noviluteimonas lactosilytica TaxID=2888523 RepID=A0ABS8JH58_9GAMM|nr:KGG domain-containing protein [Lysobacter lactosilyticus]MCC8362945.1 KGG domain-containing protein [Lysobacter lactosilyticus]
MANQTTGNTPRGTSNRGFASMDPETQRKIAQKGGEAVSRDREHMSMIGRKGGEASGGNRNQNTTQNTQTTQFGGQESEGNR